MEDGKQRILLIVDPQIDFITGSLPVPGAEKAMDALAKYVAEHGEEYRTIIVTCDRHNISHPSFKEFGGQWPPHCVESSVGAAVWPPLMKALMPFYAHVVFLYKGEDPYQDEYSIFRSERGSYGIQVLLRDDPSYEIDICGLAGDVCVAQTLKDSISVYPKIRHRILEDFTASLDGGKLIAEMAERLRKRENLAY